MREIQVTRGPGMLNVKLGAKHRKLFRQTIDASNKHSYEEILEAKTYSMNKSSSSLSDV